MEQKDDHQFVTLEGLGYCGAVMVIASILGHSPVLRFFYLGGLSIGMIVVVRLLTEIAQSQHATPERDLPEVEEAPTEAKAEEITR